MTNEGYIDPNVPTRKLFSVGQITLATFLGSPLAGCLLLALNYRVIQRPRAAWQSIIWGLASAIVLVVVAFWLPQNFPNMVLPITYCFGMRQLVSYLQGDTISGHLAAGGKKGSWVITVAVGIGCLVIVFAVFFALFMLESMFY